MDTFESIQRASSLEVVWEIVIPGFDPTPYTLTGRDGKLQYKIIITPQALSPAALDEYCSGLFLSPVQPGNKMLLSGMLTTLVELKHCGVFFYRLAAKNNGAVLRGDVSELHGTEAVAFMTEYFADARKQTGVVLERSLVQQFSQLVSETSESVYATASISPAYYNAAGHRGCQAFTEDTWFMRTAGTGLPEQRPVGEDLLRLYSALESGGDGEIRQLAQNYVRRQSEKLLSAKNLKSATYLTLCREILKDREACPFIEEPEELTPLEDEEQEFFNSYEERINSISLVVALSGEIWNPSALLAALKTPQVCRVVLVTAGEAPGTRAFLQHLESSLRRKVRLVAETQRLISQILFGTVHADGQYVLYLKEHQWVKNLNLLQKKTQPQHNITRFKPPGTKTGSHLAVFGTLFHRELVNTVAKQLIQQTRGVVIQDCTAEMLFGLIANRFAETAHQDMMQLIQDADDGADFTKAEAELKCLEENELVVFRGETDMERSWGMGVDVRVNQILEQLGKADQKKCHAVASQYELDPDMCKK